MQTIDTLTQEPRSRPGTPTWEIARLFPIQGEWTEEAYLALDTNRLVEFTDGCLEFLPMPTFVHQLILQSLFLALQSYVSARRLGLVVFAPAAIRVGPDKLREPDIVFLGSAFKDHDLRKPPNGADLVVEVMSEGADNRTRDLVEKRADYAGARIPEYWIVDPELEEVTLLALNGTEYAEQGVFRRGQTVSSLILPGFSIAVDEIFAVTSPPDGNGHGVNA